MALVYMVIHVCYLYVLSSQLKSVFTGVIALSKTVDNGETTPTNAANKEL